MADALFRRALEAAAKALHELKADQVPADLRRVARRPLPLPPPLVASLLKGLDRYDWLREKAAEAWPEADPEASGPDRASALLLLRPPGWTAQVAALAAGLGAEQARRADEDLAGQLAKARSEAEESKRRARAEKEKGRQTVRQAQEELERERAARLAVERAPVRAEAAHEEALERLRAEIAEHSAERDAARQESRRCREELAEQRRARAAAEAQLAEAGGGASWGGDLVQLARYLDRTAAMARPPVPGGQPAASSRGAPALRLPRRFHPDKREAVDWLVARREAATVIVDGYNLAFTLAGRGQPAVGRERALMLLDRLRRVARGALRVVVVFDSRLATAVDEVRPGPVEVRFAVGEGGADGEIVELARELPGERVVVSSDREVRDHAEAAGALAIWSEALADWALRR
jgi:predicted RNA-binding protein with PIN domain